MCDDSAEHNISYMDIIIIVNHSLIHKHSPRTDKYVNVFIRWMGEIKNIDLNTTDQPF